MTDAHEVTADTLKLIRVSKGLKQKQIAEVLGIAGNHVSKIESGERGLSEAEKKLLDWYFFGTMPQRITAFPADLRGILEFDEGEWKIVEFLAKRDGFESPRPWIARKIRDYLAVFGSSENLAPEGAENTVRFHPAEKGSSETYWIDQRGGIAAGSPITGHVLEELIPVSKPYPEDHYALRVFGTSMEPKIPDDSTIIVRAWPAEKGSPKKGSIVVYSDGSGSTLKEFGYRKAKPGEEGDSFNNVPVLKSINPAFREVQTMEGGRIDAVFVEVL